MRALTVTLLAGLSLIAAGCVERLNHDEPLSPVVTEDALDADVAADLGTGDTDTSAGEIGLGYACGHDAECQSGLCFSFVDRPGGAVCSRRCDDDCPLGFTCEAHGDADGPVCVPQNLCVDIDGDGYGDGPGCIGPDCDDLNATVLPGFVERCDGLDNDCDGDTDEDFAPTSCAAEAFGACAAGQSQCAAGGEICVASEPTVELCDEIDNDCDGVIDNVAEGAEGSQVFYVDADGDGFGDRDAPTLTACAEPSGYSHDSADCDDTQATVYAGAPELCDELDNDCNDLIDDDVSYVDFYPDGDGDGYGDADGEPVNDCAPPAGYAELTGDCDDTDPARSPGAVEVPSDGVDSDCDDRELCYLDRDFDGYYGDETERVFGTDCFGIFTAGDGDLPGDCDDLDPYRNPDQTEHCDGDDDDCDGAVDNDCVCRSWEERCGDVCIRSDECCEDSDCSAPRYCPEPGADCACPGDLVACGWTECISPEACCQHVDCDPQAGVLCLDHACTGHIELDFEAQADQDPPPYTGIVASGDSWVAVVDGRGVDDSNGLCLFDDGVTSVWEPYWFVEHTHGAGVYTLDFDIHLSPGSSIRIVWRDYYGSGSSDFSAGPIMTLTNSGDGDPPPQGWEVVAADTWYHVHVIINLDLRPITWSYSLSSEVEGTREHSAEVFGDFEAIDHVGFHPLEETTGYVCVDNVVSTP